MADVMLPPGLKIAGIEWRYLESGGNTTSPYTGAIRTRNLGGDRLACTINFTIANGADRASLLAFVAALRGQTNRAIVIDPSHISRGSFPAAELFANTDFASTSGWAADNLAISASNGVLRATTTGAGGSREVRQSNGATAQYAPYIIRVVLRDGPVAGISAGPYFYDAVQQTTSYSTTHGYQIVSAVNLDTAPHTSSILTFATNAGYKAGDYIDILFASSSRCFLADGGPNLLLQSDSIDNASWTKTRSTVTANVADPMGGTTAELLREDGSAATTHYIQQNVTVTAAAQDITFSCSLASSNRTWASFAVQENTGSTVALTYINLATGAIGTTTAAGNWSNVRASAVSQGNGWWRLTLTARKTNAATSISALIVIAEADNDITFSGLTQNSIYAWRASLSSNAVPTRGSLTTTTAFAAETQVGSGFYVKGLPASTAGVLVAGDWVEITAGTRCCKRKLTASLDSDASGLGYLQVSPPVPFAVSDNAPIIVSRPISRMVCVSAPPSWQTEPGVFSRVSLDFVESGD